MAKKEKEKELWVSFDEDHYKHAIQKLVHFSTKAVNSNAIAGGVRIGNAGVDLPYIAVSTCDPVRVGLDYMKNAGQEARIIKQVNAVLSGTHIDRFESVPEEDVAVILSARAALDVGPVSFVGDPDCHLKQLIMPSEDGEDFCLTPLHSAGLNQLVNQREAVLIEAQETPVRRLFRRARMSFGGSNPHNIGLLIREMQTPLFFEAPREDAGAKKALSIHYKGFNYAHIGLIDEYLDWYDTIADQSNKHIRQTELVYFKRITSAALDKGNRALDVLVEYAYLLPTHNDEPVWLDVGVGIDCVGLINKAARNTEWRAAFSTSLANLIVHRKRYRKDGGVQQLVASKLNSQDLSRIETLINKEALS